MFRLLFVTTCLLFAAQAKAQQFSLTHDQAQCIILNIDVAKTAQSAREIIAACAYRKSNPELFGCVIRQQVKAHTDVAANAIREACQALTRSKPGSQ